jgi:hypothetical protein
MQFPVLGAVLAVTFLSVAAIAADIDSKEFGKWRSGRGTHYGADAWSIHRGSCGYGYLDPSVETGWDVAAMSDKAADFEGSCGRCKEVRCTPMLFSDGYGEWLDRTNMCYDESASIVVMVTDTCPCTYPTNYSSNKRWCCGDMYHLDLSIWAYEKLAAPKWGVIGLIWRDVPCWYKPKLVGKVPRWTTATPPPTWEKAPANWKPSMDRRASGPRWQNGKKL